MKQKKSSPDPLVASVRKLRKALGDTQPQFAVRLGLSVPTVVRYERNRRPRGKALVVLEQAAAANGLEEFARIFRNALTDELGTAAPPQNIRQMQFKNDDQMELAQALVYVIEREQFEEFSQTAKSVRRLLKTVVEQLRQDRETDEALDAQRRAMAGLIAKGRSAAEVLKLFRTTPEAVAEAFFTGSVKSMDAKTYHKKMCDVVDLLLKDGWTIKRMADQFGDGEADAFLECANDLGAFDAIREYEESVEAGDAEKE